MTTLGLDGEVDLICIPSTKGLVFMDRSMKLKGGCPQKGLFLWTGLHKAGMASDKQMLWQTESDKLAECLCESAIKNFPGRRIRTEMSDGDRDWEEDFYILRKSWCPAVFTENFFMDNHFDIEYLQSRSGKQAVVDTHVEGIVEWLEINMT